MLITLLSQSLFRILFFLNVLWSGFHYLISRIYKLKNDVSIEMLRSMSEYRNMNHNNFNYFLGEVLHHEKSDQRQCYLVWILH